MSAKYAASVYSTWTVTALTLGHKWRFSSNLRRKLKADVAAAFPSLSADDLSNLIPSKEDLNVVKIYAHKGDAVTLYCMNKNPLFFELEKQLYPTGRMPTAWLPETHQVLLTNLFKLCVFPLSCVSVYVLWRYPDLLPNLKTWPLVVQKLVSGAGTPILSQSHSTLRMTDWYKLCSPQDLMLPGVVLPSSGLPDVKGGDCCAVTVVGSRYVCARR